MLTIRTVGTLCQSPTTRESRLRIVGRLSQTPDGSHRPPLHRPDNNADAFDGDDFDRPALLKKSTFADDIVAFAVDFGNPGGTAGRERFAGLAHERLAVIG